MLRITAFLLSFAMAFSTLGIPVCEHLCLMSGSSDYTFFAEEGCCEANDEECSRLAFSEQDCCLQTINVEKILPNTILTAFNEFNIAPAVDQLQQNFKTTFYTISYNLPVSVFNDTGQLIFLKNLQLII